MVSLAVKHHERGRTTVAQSGRPAVHSSLRAENRGFHWSDGQEEEACVTVGTLTQDKRLHAPPSL